MNTPTITWSRGQVKIIDQTRLPNTFQYIYCRDIQSLWQAIRRLAVRGAPALGVAAGFGVLLGIKDFAGADRKRFDKFLQKTCDYIGSSRPTAVNLFYVLNEMRKVAAAHPEQSVSAIKKLLKDKALSLYEEDRRVCRRMGDFGAALIEDGAKIMTICNAGALATVDYGTALGVMYSAKKMGRKFKVFACETRPLLQGARLTAWELLRAGIDTTLICDSMAAMVMREEGIAAVFTGADRIAANGDTANKIGTYSLAVLARYHKVPFYVVAPRSTFDPEIRSGKDIPIEQRDKKEVRGFSREVTAPRNVGVFNPAFDVTDNKLITGIVTESGIIRPPYKAGIKKILK